MDPPPNRIEEAPSSTGHTSTRHREVIVPSRAQSTGSIVFARTLKGMPIVLSRPVRQLHLITPVLVVVLLAPHILFGLDLYNVIHLDDSTRRVLARIWMYVLPCVCCLLISATYWRAAAIRKSIRESTYELCTDCGYSLSGLPQHHSCPECGKAYDLEYVRRCLKAWAG